VSSLSASCYSRRWPRHLIHLALLACLGTLAFLPAFDHHSPEYSPWHGHTLAGEVMVTSLPERHEHRLAQPHVHPAGPNEVTRAAGGGVVFTPNPVADSVSLFPTLALVAPSYIWLTAPLSALSLLCAAGRPSRRAIPTPLPDPPPRLGAL
jgi:hypothetical protein